MIRFRICRWHLKRALDEAKLFFNNTCSTSSCSYQILTRNGEMLEFWWNAMNPVSLNYVSKVSFHNSDWLLELITPCSRHHHKLNVSVVFGDLHFEIRKILTGAPKLWNKRTFRFACSMTLRSSANVKALHNEWLGNEYYFVPSLK